MEKLNLRDSKFYVREKNNVIAIKFSFLVITHDYERGYDFGYECEIRRADGIVLNLRCDRSFFFYKSFEDAKANNNRISLSKYIENTYENLFDKFEITIGGYKYETSRYFIHKYVAYTIQNNNVKENSLEKKYDCINEKYLHCNIDKYYPSAIAASQSIEVILIDFDD